MKLQTDSWEARTGLSKVEEVQVSYEDRKLECKFLAKEQE